MAKRDLQDKMVQEMRRRKAEAEAREKELAAKKKKKTTIIVAVLCVIVVATLSIAIPVGVVQAKRYQEVDFQTFSVPTTASAAKSMLTSYNQHKVEISGYLYPCGEAMCLCKNVVASCPYVTGTIPSDGILIRKKKGSFSMDEQYVNACVKGTMMVSTFPVVISGQETYVYIMVDDIEIRI